jgi:hypothetical protein
MRGRRVVRYSAGAGIRWIVGLALFFAAGCGSLSTDPPAHRGPLRSVQRALRARLSMSAIDARDLAQMREHHGCTDQDLRELEARLASVFLPDGSIPTGLTEVRPNIVTTSIEACSHSRALAAFERNILLADLVERGEFDRVVASLREWPTIRRRVKTNDFWK